MLFELEDLKGAKVKGLHNPSKLKKVNTELELNKPHEEDSVSTMPVAPSEEGEV